MSVVRQSACLILAVNAIDSAKLTYSWSATVRIRLNSLEAVHRNVKGSNTTPNARPLFIRMVVIIVRPGWLRSKLCGESRRTVLTATVHVNMKHATPKPLNSNRRLNNLHRSHNLANGPRAAGCAHQ